MLSNLRKYSAVLANVRNGLICRIPVRKSFFDWQSVLDKFLEFIKQNRWFSVQDVQCLEKKIAVVKVEKRIQLVSKVIKETNDPEAGEQARSMCEALQNSHRQFMIVTEHFKTVFKDPKNLARHRRYLDALLAKSGDMTQFKDELDRAIEED